MPTYNDWTSVRILPMDSILIGIDGDETIAGGVYTFANLLQGSSFSIELELDPQRTSTGGTRAVAVTIKIEAAVIYNRYEELSPLLGYFATGHVSDVDLDLRAIAGQVSGAWMRISAIGGPTSEIADIDLKWRIESADMMPRLTLSVDQTCSIDILKSSSSMFHQLSGF